MVTRVEFDESKDDSIVWGGVGWGGVGWDGVDWGGMSNFERGTDWRVDLLCRTVTMCVCVVGRVVLIKYVG